MLVTMKEITRNCLKENYAVPCFDTPTVETVFGAIRAAEALNAPVIIAHCYRFYGEIDIMGHLLTAAAQAARVPVCVHVDHSIEEEQIIRGIRGGYSSIMIDGSERPYRENVEITKKVVEWCHPLGISVEAELGHVPDFDNIDSYDGYMYTSPDAVQDFVKNTNTDFLAVAVGTIHGPYRMEPKIRYDILKRISEKVGDSCRLVIHGSSGITDEDYLKCIDHGVVKFNIFTDYAHAAFQYWRNHTPGRAPSYVEAVTGCVPVVQERCEKYLKLLGCENKSWL